MEAIDKKSNREVFCDHFGCDQKMKVENAGEITFGVHPDFQSSTSSNHLITRQSRFYFCDKHAKFYEDCAYSGLSCVYVDASQIIGSAYFVKGFGCWVTIHLRCFHGEPIQNFQMSYGNFVKAFSLFKNMPSLGLFPMHVDRAKKLKMIKFEVNLSANW